MYISKNTIKLNNFNKKIIKDMSEDEIKTMKKFIKMKKNEKKNNKKYPKHRDNMKSYIKESYYHDI